MDNFDRIFIRPFDKSDYSKISEIIAHSFKSKFLHLSNLSLESLISFMSDAVLLENTEQEGYWVAEYKNVVQGVMKLSWHNKKRVKVTKILTFKELVGKYGLFNVIKLNLSMLLLNENPGEGDCYIEHIAVAESARGLGIGRALMNKAKMDAFEMDHFDRMTLYVANNNEGAITLYERLGYQVVNRKSSLITKWAFNQKTWLFMAQYKNEKLKGKLSFNKLWWLGFIGFIGFTSLSGIIDVFKGNSNYWYLLNLLWFYWFVYLIPKKQ